MICHCLSYLQKRKSLRVLIGGKNTARHHYVPLGNSRSLGCHQDCQVNSYQIFLGNFHQELNSQIVSSDFSSKNKNVKKFKCQETQGHHQASHQKYHHQCNQGPLGTHSQCKKLLVPLVVSFSLSTPLYFKEMKSLMF